MAKVSTLIPPNPIGRGKELDDALNEALAFLVKHPHPGYDNPKALADWYGLAKNYRQAIGKAAETAPIGYAASHLGNWPLAFTAAAAATNTMDAALALARHGLFIFPCNPKIIPDTGKPSKGPHPILGALGGCYWATDDPRQIREWWTAQPRAMIGLIMGRRNGVLALDIDTEEAHGKGDGPLSFTRLGAAIKLPVTRIHRTYSGGSHVLWQWFDNGPHGKPVDKDHPFTVDKVVYPGIEVIGEGGFIVCPPSKTLDGLAYTVDADEPPAPAPAKLRAALANGKHKVEELKTAPQPEAKSEWDPKWCQEQLDIVVKALEQTTKGTYDETAKHVMKIGGIVAGGGLEDEKAWEALAEAAGASDKPRDYLAKVQRAYEKGKDSPWEPKQQGVRWFDWYGRALPTLVNTVLALDNLELSLYFDECRHREMVIEPSFAGEVSDATALDLRTSIRLRFGFDPGKDTMFDGIKAVCSRNSRHPFDDWLNSLVWDGVSRLDTLLTVYFGAADTEYVRALSRIMLIAAVRRVKHPGCEFQLFIVLQGPQGKGKSKALKLLVGLEYFSDQNILGLKTIKEQIEAMEGVVLYELSELQGVTDKTVEAVKAFASRQVDQARMAWGRFKAYRYRRCIFVGTVNDFQFLHDRTGNRRFGPVSVGEIDLDALERDRDQLWAEAVAREARGDSIELPRELWGIAAEEQDNRLVSDPWDDILSDIEAKAGSLIERCEGEMRIKSRDILSNERLLNLQSRDQSQYFSKRLGHVMRKLGWTGPAFMWFPVTKSRDRGYSKPDTGNGPEVSGDNQNGEQDEIPF